MPYEIIKDTNGYFVETKETGRRHSKLPFKTKKEASAQMRALYAAENKKREAVFYRIFYSNNLLILLGWK